MGYLDFIGLEIGAWKIATYSGGIQKEAYLAGKPCITIRKQTEWIETIEAGWNVITSNDSAIIKMMLNEFEPSGHRPNLYGDGFASKEIVNAIDSQKEKIKL